MRTLHGLPHQRLVRHRARVPRWFWRGVIGLALGLLLALRGARADSFTWTNVTGGDFTNPANWDLAVPTSTDQAVFASDATYTVGFSLTTNTGSATFQAGTTILDIGAGNVWTLNNGLQIANGVSQIATVIVASGSNVVAATGQINIGGGGSGALVVTNAGLSLGGGQEVHFKGNVSLIVSNGGYAQIANYQNDGDNNSFVVRGAGSVLDVPILSQYYGGSNFAVTVTDGATLTANTQFQVGKNHCSVIVSNGGQLITASLAAAVNYSGVLVTDTGSVWRAASGDFWLGAGGDNAYVMVANGGLASVGTVYLGSSGGQSNSITVTDPGSVLTNGIMFVGGWGGAAVGANNYLFVKRGGQLITIDRASVGDNSAAVGNQVLVTDTGSVWSVANGLFVGNRGSGNSVTISNGSAIYSGSGTIGGGGNWEDLTGLSNSVFVTGPGSLWNNSGEVIVGYSPAQNGDFTQNSSGNTLAISGGASVIANGVTLGSATGGGVHPSSANSNSVVVIGVGSSLINNGALTVGNGGYDNSVLVSAGGAVVNNGPVTLNGGSVSILNTGTVASADVIINNGCAVTIADAGSVWNTGTFNMQAAYGGSASVVISNGGALNIITTAGNQANFIGGGQFNTYNMLLVTDPGSTLTNLFNGNGSLTVGDNNNPGIAGPSAYNSLIVSNGGRAYIAGGSQFNIGGNYTSNNTVVVTGTNSVLDVSMASFNIDYGGGRGGNKLTVANGGLLISGAGTIGTAGAAGNNSALVTDPGSAWTNSSTLAVGGGSSSNTLTVANGGVYYGGDAVSVGAGGTGNAVTVNGGLFFSASALTINTNNDLVILGGQLTASSLVMNSASLTYQLPTAVNAIIVNDLTLNGGTLTITSGGAVTAGTYTLATYSGTLNNTMTVNNPLPGGLTGSFSSDATHLFLVVSGGGGPNDPFATWQTNYFSPSELADLAFSGPNADPLGKGISNTNQFLAGFNPTNSAAYPHIISLVKSGTDMEITYLGASGDSSYTGGPTSRTNVLEFTTGSGAGSYSNDFVSTGQTNVLSGGTGLGTVASFVDTNGATGTARYYRVRLLP